MKKTKKPAAPKKTTTKRTKTSTSAAAKHPHDSAVHTRHHHSESHTSTHLHAHTHSHHMRGKQLDKKQATYAVGIFLLAGLISIAVYNSYSTPFEVITDKQTETNLGEDKAAVTLDRRTAQIDGVDNNEALDENGDASSAPLVDGKCQIESGILTDDFQKTRNMPMADRINYWSAYLERNGSAKKNVAKLARGAKSENALPLVTERYDSIRFVETVAALARSNNGREFVSYLTALRYKDGQKEFSQKNYFVDADWIPNNKNAGILKDITSDIASSAGVDVQTETHQIIRAKWLKGQLEKQGDSRGVASIMEAWSTPSDVQVPYINLANLNKTLAQLPQGSILNLVHSSDANHAGLITHHGFVIREGDQVLFRHASARGQIRSHELTGYMKKLARGNRRGAKWALIGVNVDQVNASSSVSSCLSSAM